jgi:thioredoxin-related protein
MKTLFARVCRFTAILAVILSGSVAAAGTASAGELVMFDSKSCTICRRFNAEIGDAGYAASNSAHTFPLRRINIHNGTVDFQLELPVTMTPTFVFVEKGAEVARFVGYPGRDYFFTLVDAAVEAYLSASGTR